MGVLNNINYINKVSVFPFELPGPVVLIETAIEAGAPTLLELESWSCRDILKLRAGISYRCGRTLKAIIKAAHGAEVIDSTHFIYKFAAPVDRLLWYWFVADLATSFVAHWTSLVYQSQGCIGSKTSVHANGPGTGLTLANPGEEVPLAYLFTVTGDDKGLISSTSFVVPPNWYYQVHFSAEATPLFSDNAVPLSVYLVENVGGFEVELPGTRKGGGEGHDTRVSNLHKGQASAAGVTHLFYFKAKADKLSLVKGIKAEVTISQLPILEEQSFGVGCFNRDWSQESVEGHVRGLHH